jgi:hypothetical protein
MAQEMPAPPSQPFQAVHLYHIDVPGPEAEKKMIDAYAEINKAIAKAGCKKCVYHLWKAHEQPEKGINYIQVSWWPGREIYEKVHKDAGFLAAGKKAEPAFGSMVKEQTYNRYVEIVPGK